MPPFPKKENKAPKISKVKASSTPVELTKNEDTLRVSQRRLNNRRTFKDVKIASPRLSNIDTQNLKKLSNINENFDPEEEASPPKNRE